MRHFRFWASHVLRFRTGLVVTPLLESLVDLAGRRASFEGIKIVAPPTPGKGPEPPFLRHTVAALRLIQSMDPRRFRRVQREIAVISAAPGLSFASYGRPGRRCRVDFACVDTDLWQQEPEWYHWFYATVLVHEATHGAIYSRHVQYTPKLRARIERLCCAEARRFATRADREDRQWSDALVPEFDERKWYESWHLTRWQRTKRLFARLREVLRDEKTKR